jgi:hypothetical protein
MNSLSPTRLVLRDLPLAVRLTLSAFLISVGIGYLAALVQLHIQHAAPGSLLPSGKRAVEIFHGSDEKQSKIESLITADPALPLKGEGQMVTPFFQRSDRWKDDVKEKAKELAGNPRGPLTPEQLARGEAEVRKTREGERQAVLAWIRAGASKKDYEANKFCLPDDLAKQPITEEFLVKEDGQPDGTLTVAIKKILETRCVRCHSPNNEADKFPLESYEQLKPYVTVKEGSGAMSLPKLAQSTHVHLLGFAMLYGLTGLIFAFTGYPSLARCLLAPLPLVAQMVDIGCWWLARLEAPFGPYFAMFIPVTGGIVAVGLLLHIVLSLFDLYGKVGKVVLVLLLGGVIAGGVALDVKGKISNYLDSEKAPAAASE